MIKSIINSGILTAALLFSACGSDNEAEERLETQQMLDDGDYEAVIAKLEGSADSKEDYLTLASAYMGRAGFSLLDVVSVLSDEDADLVSSLGKRSSYKSTLDLEKATAYYQEAVGKGTCAQDNNGTLSGSQKDICLYIGLSAVTKVASTVTLLVGDIDSFASDDFNATTDYKLKASGCALKYAFDNNATVPAECTITPSSDVNFTVTNKIYTPITVVANDDTNSTPYYYLMTQPDTLTNTRQTALTSGYCSNTSFTPRVDDYNSSLYACPVNETPDEEETTSMNILVDALNGGLDSVLAATETAAGEEEEEDDIQSSIDEFKCEVLDGEYFENEPEGSRCKTQDNSTVSLDTDISEEQVIDYLNNQNN